MADGVGHRRHGEPEGQRHAEQPDADTWERGGQDRAATTSQNEPECADKFRCICFHFFSYCCHSSYCARPNRKLLGKIARDRRPAKFSPQQSNSIMASHPHPPPLGPAYSSLDQVICIAIVAPAEV